MLISRSAPNFMMVILQNTSINTFYEKEKNVIGQIIWGNATYYPYCTLTIYINIFNNLRNPKVNKHILTQA